MSQSEYHVKQAKNQAALILFAQRAKPQVESASVPVAEPAAVQDTVPVPQASAQLVQITAAPAPVPQATLPSAATTLTIHEIFDLCMEGVDLQDEALAKRDRQSVKNAHVQIQWAQKQLKETGCSSYRYPNPARNNKNQWNPLCDSGRTHFFKSVKTCTNCPFFNMQYSPKLGHRPAKQASPNPEFATISLTGMEHSPEIPLYIEPFY